MSDKWQNIETAPKDGTRILGYAASVGVASFAWNKTYSEWWVDPNDATEANPEAHELIAWMPLPGISEDIGRGQRAFPSYRDGLPPPVGRTRVV